MQRYWTGASWTTDVRLPPVSPRLIPPPLVADDVWPPPVDPPESFLAAAKNTLNATEDADSSAVARRWYSRKRFIVPLVLVTAIAVVGLLTRTTDGQDTTDVSPVATTIQATTSTVAATTTQPSTTTQAAATAISPEEQFESWVASMTVEFEGGPPPEDDISLTESNAAFLCSRARGDETYDSLERFVRQFFYDAEPQKWSQQPEVLDNYSTAYINTSLNVYCPDTYAQLMER